MLTNNKNLFILIAILLLAGFLRFYRLGSLPPSLYSDEAAQGYNAYSLFNSGRDEHGRFWPVSLRSFGDWKPPLPTLLMIPVIAVNGLNETSVRFPGAFLGTATVYLTYLLVKILLINFSGKNKIALLSSFILTVSPWHILQSRAAMLVMVALFFLMLGTYLFLKGNRRMIYFLFGVFFLTLSVYAYYGLRLVTPLIFIILLFLSPRFFYRKTWLLSFLIIFSVILPLIIGYLNNPDVIFGRARTISVFYDQGVNLRLWELTTQDGLSSDPLITRFFHNRWYLYGKQIVNNFFSHFDGRYLFLAGDQSQPFKIPGQGILLFIEVVFFPSGLYFLIKKNLSRNYFLLFWLLISVLPAALTFMVPSSNRSFNAVFPYAVIISIGIYFLASLLNSKLTSSLITMLYLINFLYFMNSYFLLLPRDNSSIWNYGWREAVTYVKKLEKQYDNIIISDVNGMPYIYFLFYNQYDPAQFQKEAVRSYAADRFGFEHVESFSKYIFQYEFDVKLARQNKTADTLYLVPADFVPEGEKFGQSVYYPNGKAAIRIF
ncbi:hypothetical protein A2153_05785 [Candidatus Gottesmanbacteria bacterium RBG_16_38_7b]|uniref:ArnT-like N-terminal domain-containing protein n=1 Tax=Candidatus Gottesmanbacteria bacterium RBG_16_38_7b TaxID=1798372 RepID=A0A1F5YIN1_9BACT|nr:MAG: hypothetical protein A2153_05785 [Candidatus Gottesmanbacteria bacterium RBG_16_38_7b]